MKKFVIRNNNDGCYMSSCLICVEEDMADVYFSSDLNDVFFFSSLQDATALLDYLQAVSDSDIVQQFVVVGFDV